MTLPAFPSGPEVYTSNWRQFTGAGQHIDGLQGIFAHYLLNRTTTLANEDYEVNGIPIFRAVTGNTELLGTPTGRQRCVDSLVEQIKKLTPKGRPGFLHVSLTNWMVDMSVLMDAQKALGPEYVFVRPEQMVTLYKASKK